MSELHPNWAECSKIVVVLGKIPDLFLQWVHSPSSYRCLERHECHECGMCRSERDASGTRGGSTSRKTGAMKEGSLGDIRPDTMGISWAYTSSTAQGRGGSFKNRKPIGEAGCCESRMAERSH